MSNYITKEGIVKYLHKLQPFSKEEESIFSLDGISNWLGQGDIDMIYSFCRYNKPKRIVELGRGYSTIIMSSAYNKDETFESYVSIDPSPYHGGGNSAVDSNKVSFVNEMTQNASIDIFRALQPGDFLFIDSSHTTEEQLYLIQNVFSILPKGVFVHHHDIQIMNYDLDVCSDPTHHPGMGEETTLIQYLRSDNSRLKLILSSHLFHHDHDGCQEWYKEIMGWLPEVFGASLFSVSV